MKKDNIIKQNLKVMEKHEDEAIAKYGNFSANDIMQNKHKDIIQENYHVINDKNHSEIDSDDENIMFDIKESVKGVKLFGENLYDPLQDQKTEAWVNKKLRIISITY